MPGKAVGVDGGRGDDQLQIGPSRQDLFDVAQQEVDVQAALVRLVDDQRVVGVEQRVGLRLGQQNAVGHQLDAGARRQAVAKAHLVTHHLAQRRAQFFGNALGDTGGGDAARLGVTDQLAALARPRVQPPAPHGQGDLGQLRGLARAGFAAHDDHLVRAQRGLDLGAARRHRQAVGEIDGQAGWRVAHGAGDYPRAELRAPDGVMFLP